MLTSNLSGSSTIQWKVSRSPTGIPPTITKTESFTSGFLARGVITESEGGSWNPGKISLSGGSSGPLVFSRVDGPVVEFDWKTVQGGGSAVYTVELFAMVSPDVVLDYSSGWEFEIVPVSGLTFLSDWTTSRMGVNPAAASIVSSIAIHVDDFLKQFRLKIAFGLDLKAGRPEGSMITQIIASSSAYVSITSSQQLNPVESGSTQQGQEDGFELLAIE